MALKVKILEEHDKIVGRGILDGTIAFRFDDFGDRWSVRIGKTWQHMEGDRHRVGQPQRAEARQKIYAALARFRNEAKLSIA